MTPTYEQKQRYLRMYCADHYFVINLTMPQLERLQT